ncbi:hypothetical protein Pcinc_015468 [Petrolisthes cinctipes]|uniref:Uncharacterized protein n=1 Tax=Petrolisthes cinctipes TaxID=88211 RepID=A0AAE1KQF5_PETCI|nr:hypothetical protein Pcinc_015468 [Petrolisthes cinctipes]
MLGVWIKDNMRRWTRASMNPPRLPATPYRILLGVHLVVTVLVSAWLAEDLLHQTLKETLAQYQRHDQQQQQHVLSLLLNLTSLTPCPSMSPVVCSLPFVGSLLILPNRVRDVIKLHKAGVRLYPPVNVEDLGFNYKVFVLVGVLMDFLVWFSWRTQIFRNNRGVENDTVDEQEKDDFEDPKKDEDKGLVEHEDQNIPEKFEKMLQKGMTTSMKREARVKRKVCKSTKEIKSTRTEEKGEEDQQPTEPTKIEWEKISWPKPGWYRGKSRYTRFRKDKERRFQIPGPVPVIVRSQESEHEVKML